MMDLNTPWVESPFFEKELEKRGHLTEVQKGQARFYNENGFLILKNALNESQVDAALQALNSDSAPDLSAKKPRTQDLWKKEGAIKDLATHNGILSLLKNLYDREPIPFQTLNFKYGSRQKAHSDTIHFNSFPQRFMCASWMALEDVDEENGAVFYYPGSHKLNICNYDYLSPKFLTADKPNEIHNYVKLYEPFISQLMDVHNIKPKSLILKKGDVLIWSANLVHGGLPIEDKNRTRWSQVNHYFFEDCLYYTPLLSNAMAGEWFLRKITNIKTGQSTKGSYNGHIMKRKLLPNLRYLISDHALYSWRDLRFLLTRVYYKLFK